MKELNKGLDDNDIDDIVDNLYAQEVCGEHIGNQAS